MAKTKEQSLHINSISIALKNELKKIAKRDERSLEKQVVYILKDYVEKRKNSDDKKASCYEDN